jgi:hypothetical protein
MSIRHDARLIKHPEPLNYTSVDFGDGEGFFARVVPVRNPLYSGSVIAHVWYRDLPRYSGRWYMVDAQGRPAGGDFLPKGVDLFPLLDIAHDLGLEFPALANS